VPTWICLLRGVNLGKRRQLPMAALRDALGDAGLTGVRTYLQSGNVVAQSPAGAAAEVSRIVHDVIATEFALDVPVVTRSPAGLDAIIEGNPFAAQAAERAHLVRVIFLVAEPTPEGIGRLAADAAVRDTCRVAGSHVYVDYVRGYHGTSRTAAYFTRALGVDGTERNWRTVLALAGLARADG
jgi:uncharacterized protein (DUF1697 family)